MNFPSSPAVNDTYTNASGQTWVWNGTLWVVSTDTTSLVKKSGDTMTGNLDMDGNQILNAEWGGKGWVHIDSGSVSAVSSAVLTVPTGFSSLRLTLAGFTSETNLVNLRVNNDTTADLHRQRLTIRNDSTGAVDGTPINADGTQWPLAQWSAATGCTAEALIPESPGGRHGFVGRGARPGGTTGFSSLSSGRLQGNRTITSLVLIPTSPATITANWTLEGYRE